MALFCVLAWGVSYAVIRDTVQQIPPLTLACLRHILGAILIWPLVRMRCGRIRIPWRDQLFILGLALSGVTLYFGFENHSLKLTSASHGALLIALIPLGTELVTALRKRQAPALIVWIGTLAALAGVTILVGSSDGVATLTGDLLMLGAVVSWIIYTFGIARFSGRYPGLLLTRQIMLFGALSLLPGMAYELAGAPLPQPDPGAWLGLLFLTVICSVVGYDFWNRAVPALGPNLTNTLLYLLPMVGVIAGIFALDEPVTDELFIGGGLILCGVVLAGKGQRIKRKSMEPCHVE